MVGVDRRLKGYSDRMRLSSRASSLFLILLATVVCIAPAGVVFAQDPPPSGTSSLSDLPACTLQGRSYICSKPALGQVLAATRTVAIVSQPANHASDAALASLAKSLGKTISAGSEASPADLTLRLTPVEPAGVSVGAGTVDLAMLNIFLSAPGKPTGKLVWSETYNGDPDMPWPAVVHALTRQFKSHMGIK